MSMTTEKEKPCPNCHSVTNEWGTCSWHNSANKNEKITRSEYDKKYNYRPVLSSDNIDLRHCGNCKMNNYFQKQIEEFDKCSRMEWLGVPSKETTVSCSRAVCDLWQRKNK